MRRQFCSIVIIAGKPLLSSRSSFFCRGWTRSLFVSLILLRLCLPFFLYFFLFSPTGA